MRRKNLKIFLIFMVTLFLCLGGLSVKAEDSTQTTSDGLKVQCDYYAKTAVITGCSGSPTEINIPEEYDGCTIIGIRYEAFAYEKTIEKVNIPKTVTQIGNKAFSNCTLLKEVNISQECVISELGDGAFSNCSVLSKVVLPKDGFETIGASAFSGCASLTSFIVGKNTKTIGTSAFSGCSQLTDVTFCEGLQKIENCAFMECTSLVNVVFPNSIKNIGEQAFSGCTKLENATNVPTIDNYTFNKCSVLKVVKFQNKAEYIGVNALANTAIETIVIPSGINIINSEAFNECNNLSKVYVLSKNISITNTAFKRNSKLTVFGFAGSGAEQCAKAAGLNFTSITGPELTYKENKKHEIELSWSDVANVTQYDVYRSTMENGEYTLLESLGTNVLSYTDKSVERGKKYFYYVSAKTTLEDGTILDIPSTVVSVATKDVTLKVSREKVTVNYSTSVTVSYFVDKGNVEYDVDNPAIASAEWVGDFYGNEIKLKITGLKKGKTNVTISNSENSDTVTIEVIVNKAKVKVAQVKGASWKKKSTRHQVGDGLTYIFSWKRVSGASGYEVKIYEKETTYDGWYSFTKKTKKANASVSFSYLYRLKAKVRAYKVVDGKTFYGKWSTMKTAKIRY